jgi:NAD(P)-dependent dehydrogenase (short-subunit alcohol dehydrogenase family)
MVSAPKQRVVLVTGAADGIGRAIALRLLADGWSVFIGDNRPDALSATLASAPSLRGCVVDVGDLSQVRQFFEAAAPLGAPDALVNNVGIGGPRAAIEDIEAADWEQVFRINVAGALYCMQAAIPAMKTRRAGAIVNVSTGSTRTALPYRTPYVASKYALEGLTRNAARELGPFGIRCNAVLPGIMDNPRMDGIIAAKAEREGREVATVEAEFLRYVSMRARTRPDDVAATVAYLLSDDAARVTGELVAVSGNLEWEE